MVRLSQLGRLDHATFGRLLQLLGRALAASPRGDHTRRAVTADGRMEIVLAAPEDGRTAVITTPYGTFRGPDYAIEITAMFQPSTSAAYGT